MDEFSSMDPPAPGGAPEPDGRLYVPVTEGWQARIKGGWDQQYCWSKTPGEDFFHRLMSGEIYLENGEEIVCLMCALRRGLVTTDRLFWRKRGAKRGLPSHRG